jgi:hypothetical protein
MRRLPDHKDASFSQNASSSELLQVVLHEYDALRAEILKRIEIMYQISTLALIAPATLFAFGLGTQNASVILVYPVLALFLSLLWGNYDRNCRRLGFYIKTHIESHFPEDTLCWEHYMHTNRSKRLLFDWGNLGATLGIFAGSEILALVVGIPVALKYGTILPLNLLISVAVISILITGIRLLWPLRFKQEALTKEAIGLLLSPTTHDGK